MSIHENLPPQVRKDLKQVGWTKGVELAKLARKQGQHFESATWLHKARQMPKEEFRREVEKELTGRDSEPSELILLQGLQEPDPGHRAGDRDRGPDAGLRQVARLLPGDDLRRLPGRSAHGRQQSGDPAAIALALLHRSCRDHSRRLFCPRSAEKLHEQILGQEPASADSIRRATANCIGSAGARWLALPDSAAACGTCRYTTFSFEAIREATRKKT